VLLGLDGYPELGSIQDLVWKSGLDTQSTTESVNVSQELVELEKENEEQAKKVSEIEVENFLSEPMFFLDESNQTLWE